MRKNLLLLFAFFFIGISAVSAQNEKEIKKAVKSATKAFQKYKLSPGDETKLQAAQDAVSAVLSMPGADKNVKAWQTKGDIYSLITENEEAKKLEAEAKANITGDKVKPFSYADVSAPVTAFEAYSKAYSLAGKDSEKTSILKSLESNLQYLNNVGITVFQAKEFDKAYDLFNTILSSHKIISGNGGKSLLDTPEKIEDYTLYAAYSAQQSGKEKEGMALYQKMAESGSTNVGVYEALFKAYQSVDEAKAMSYLEKGREIDPEDGNLLFAEINYYLGKGEYAKLESKLGEAIEREPNNASVRSVMGNVYNKLHLAEADPVKKKEYFDKAGKFFNEALEIDDQNFDAIYSLGELKYNKAASMTEELNKLSDDLTKEGMRKYDTLKSNMDKLFDEALPYFLKAHDVNPKDANTLIALKELYARKNDTETSKKYKDLIDSLN